MVGPKGSPTSPTWSPSGGPGCWIRLAPASRPDGRPASRAKSPKVVGHERSGDSQRPTSFGRPLTPSGRPVGNDQPEQSESRQLVVSEDVTRRMSGAQGRVPCRTTLLAGGRLSLGGRCWVGMVGVDVVGPLVVGDRHHELATRARPTHDRRRGDFRWFGADQPHERCGAVVVDRRLHGRRATRTRKGYPVPLPRTLKGYPVETNEMPGRGERREPKLKGARARFATRCRPVAGRHSRIRDRGDNRWDHNRPLSLVTRRQPHFSESTRTPGRSNDPSAARRVPVTR